MAAVCFANASLAKHRMVFPQVVFGVAEFYLYVSSRHLPATHIKEEVATLAAHRKNNYPDEG